MAERIVFFAAPSTLNRFGFSAKEIKGYSTAIARGELPDGFESIEDFDKYILMRIKDGGALKARKKSARKA